MFVEFVCICMCIHVYVHACAYVEDSVCLEDTPFNFTFLEVYFIMFIMLHKIWNITFII